LFYCTDWRSVHSVECGVSGVQLDGGQHGVTAGGSGHSGGSSGIGDGGSGVVEGETSGDREASGVGVGKAGDGGSSNNGGGSLLVSRPLAIGKGGMSIGDDGSSVDLVGDLSRSDHIRLDNGGVGDSADRGEGGHSSGKGSGVGQTIAIASIGQDLGVSLSLSLAVEGVSVGDNRSSGDLVRDLSRSDHIRLDNNRLGDSADRGKSGDGSGKSSCVGKSGIGKTSQDLGVSLSLLPLSSSGGGSIESSLELSLGGDNLSGVLDRSGALKVEHRGDKGSNLGGSRGGGSHGEVGGGDSEAVHGVGHIVDSLEEAIGVNVLVTAGGHSIGVSGLGLG